VGGYNFNYSNFTNACGDGTLTAAGAANTANWPVSGGGQGGGILRGGGVESGLIILRISENGQMNTTSNQGRVQTVGGRGVR
ncbi:MAG: hypothetical protein ACK5OP_15060, partial [Sphingobacteriales bacterium]